MEREADKPQDVPRFTIDTHILLWYLAGNKKLSRVAADHIKKTERGEALLLIPVASLFECVDMLQKRKITQQTIDEILLVLDQRSDFWKLVPLDKGCFDALWDRLSSYPTGIKSRDVWILATALKNESVLLTEDQEIVNSGLVKTVRV